MNTPSVDELRARLRELGYLDAGVDRFVLGGVRETRGLFSVAWRSSVRIGLLAALLLGPSTALALGVRLPGLVTGLRDGLVLALYLGVLFGVAVTVAALLATLLLGVLAARVGADTRLAGRLSGAAAIAVGAACLVYLVLWWRTVGAGAASFASAWTWPVLAGAAAVSLLLGHAVRLATLAVVARTTRAAAPALRRPSRSAVVTLGLGMFLFALAAGLLFLVTPRSGASTTVQRTLPPIATGAHVTVVAVDGLDLAFVEREIEAGHLPTLARLLGGSAATLPASDAPDPARTWTSLATGQPAEVHGISGIETRRVSGLEGTVPTVSSGLDGLIAAATDLVRLTRPTLTTSLQRRSKTFWEVAAQHGLSTLVVNWWATWPVPEGAGTVLSDRAMLRLDVGGTLDAEIAPAGLYPELRRAWPDWRAEARLRALTALGGDLADSSLAGLRRAADEDAAATVLATRAAHGSPALRAVYLPGLDVVQHELIGRSAAALPPSAMASRLEALGRYYRFLDSLVAALVSDSRPQDLVVLVADPGRSASRSAGLLAISGEGARAGVRIQAARRDVMPTLLFALGLPTSRELPGRPRTELFSYDFAQRVPVRFVDTFGPSAAAPRPANATPLDQEMLDRLRSLGYVR